MLSSAHNKCTNYKGSYHGDVMSYNIISEYCIVGFFKVLKFHEWLIFTILFSQMGLPKAQQRNGWFVFFQGAKFHE